MKRAVTYEEICVTDDELKEYITRILNDYYRINIPVKIEIKMSEVTRELK